MKYVYVLFLCLLIGGCSLYEKDPQTGELVMKEGAQKAAEAAQAVAETIEATAPLVSVWWPPAALIAGLASGVAATIRSIRPKLARVQTERDLYYKAGEATAIAIEKFKKEFPKEWETLEHYFEKAHGPEIENVFRGFRGLPPKL